MPATPDRDRVTASAQAAVAAAAPGELPFFPAAAAQYFRRPRRSLAGRGPRDEALGSGGAAVVALVSPIALAVATAVHQHLTDRTAEAVTGAVTRLARRLWRRLFGRWTRGANGMTRGSAPAVRFSAAQRAEVRAVAEARARALGLPEEQVTLLVGAIMDSLDHG